MTAKAIEAQGAGQGRAASGSVTHARINVAAVASTAAAATLCPAPCRYDVTRWVPHES